MMEIRLTNPHDYQRPLLVGDHFGEEGYRDKVRRRPSVHRNAWNSLRWDFPVRDYLRRLAQLPHKTLGLDVRLILSDGTVLEGREAVNYIRSFR